MEILNHVCVPDLLYSTGQTAQVQARPSHSATANVAQTVFLYADINFPFATSLISPVV